MTDKLLQQALTFAGALGRFQGLIAFIRQNPDAYSHERLLEELFKLDDEESAKIEALEAKFKDEAEQE